nr:exonuclease SbcCD subunit D C-terminal domain-containing protein [Wohlfahrtiimonas chitiniclastica]
MTMKLLHTADWHLGRALYGHKRHQEFSEFLAWMIKTLTEEKIDVLLIAGDVFDTNLPSNRAQAMYYEFLHQVSRTDCQHVVITAGNHDSPTFLNAPQALLKALNVHVIGQVSADLSDEVITLTRNGVPELIVCAVPYLRDKDMRIMTAGESLEDKNRALIRGIEHHYQAVTDLAIAEQSRCAAAGHQEIPIVAMGHLFAAGGETLEGDGVRDLYVGNLAYVNVAAFPTELDYVALGHLHVPQIVGGCEHIRYSGSPIAMGFGEAKQNKSVVIIEFVGRNATISLLPIPRFQALERISGDLDTIEARLDALREMQQPVWLEIEYTGNAIVGDLRGRLETRVAGSSLMILRIKNQQVLNHVMQVAQDAVALEELSVEDVFEACLKAADVLPESSALLRALHQEVVQSLNEDDQNAE